MSLQNRDCLPFAHQLGNIELAEDFRLDERQLFREVLHVWACAAAHCSHRIRRVFPEVHAMQLGDNCTEFAANRSKQRVDNGVEGGVDALDHSTVSRTRHVRVTGLTAILGDRLFVTFSGYSSGSFERRAQQ